MLAQDLSSFIRWSMLKQNIEPILSGVPDHQVDDDRCLEYDVPFQFDFQNGNPNLLSPMAPIWMLCLPNCDCLYPIRSSDGTNILTFDFTVMILGTSMAWSHNVEKIKSEQLVNNDLVSPRTLTAWKLSLVCCTQIYVSLGPPAVIPLLWVRYLY